jgi:hypothetical protein
MTACNAATLLNVPVGLLPLVHAHRELVTIAGGSALAVRHHTIDSLMLPSSDVDIFFFKAATTTPTPLIQFVQCLRDWGYVVCRSRSSVITAVHSAFRTVQLIGSDYEDAAELVGQFDFCNVQVYYDGACCYETVQAFRSNSTMTLDLAPDIRLSAVDPRRLEKMVLKGFGVQSEQLLRYRQATVLDPGVDMAYDYPVLSENHHPRVRDNILRKFGLLPIPMCEALGPLTPVPTYPTRQKTTWKDHLDQASLDLLASFITTRVIKTFQESRIRIHGVSWPMSIDLGVGCMPAYLTGPSDDDDDGTQQIREEEDAFIHLKNLFRTLEIKEKNDYLRLHAVCRGITMRVSELSGTELFDPPGQFKYKYGLDGRRLLDFYWDVNVTITKETEFYFDGKRIELFTTIASVLRSPDYLYHAFAENALILEAFGHHQPHPLPVIFRFHLKKVIILRRSGHFKMFS